MSAAASAGPPSSNGVDGFRGGPSGHSHASTGKSSNRAMAAPPTQAKAYRHIADILAARPNVNPESSMKKLLDMAETHAKQADTWLDFRREDLALEEYVKATIITSDIIPRHKEYATFENTEYYRTWRGLCKRIVAQGPKFDHVKACIQANNAYTQVHSHQNKNDVAPDNSRSETPFSAESSTVSSPSLSLSSSIMPPPTRKPPPPVQRKPTALHGNTLISTPPKIVPAQEELVDRFARLRSTAVVQDPRIKTRPIDLSIPAAKATSSYTISAVPAAPSAHTAGPRDMPNVPNGLLGKGKHQLIVDIPSMPKPPDAVYSPARGPEASSGVTMPRQGSRSSITGPSRTNSLPFAAPLNTSTDRIDCFQPPTRPGTSNSSTTPSHRPISSSMPQGTIITAQELTDCLKRSVRLLLVDVRRREEFDDGHINVPSIICIEPLNIQEGISGAELGERMLLSPESEQALFASRHEVDVVVYYNQCSISTQDKVEPGHGPPLRVFSDALFEYSYGEDKLARRPMLLQGGLDAWTDLMGSQSLVATKTVSSDIIRSLPARSRPANGLTRARPSAGTRRTYESRPMTQAQEIEWNKTVANEALASPSVVNGDSDMWFAKSQDDFLRRYPDITRQESMVVAAPVRAVRQPFMSQNPTGIDPRHREAIEAQSVKPPTRPTPAVPRPSYRGASEKEQRLAGPQPLPPPVESLGNQIGTKGRTGLVNLGNSCYMNAVIQVLSATRVLSWYLAVGDYLRPEHQVPRKPTEDSDPPQLMAKNLANLFRHIWSGSFTYVVPKTFHDYTKAISQEGLNEHFGDSNQHDASEFLTYVLGILQDELNPSRDRIGSQPQPGSGPTNAMPPLQAAIFEWNRHFMEESSIIYGLFGGQFNATFTCGKCRHSTRTFESFTSIYLEIREDGRETLYDAFDRTYRVEALDGYSCDQCKERKVTKALKLSRYPECLVINLRRACFNQKTSAPAKLHTLITYELNELKLDKWFIGAAGMDEQNMRGVEMRPYVGPFRYECYAVIHHLGPSANSGHYWATVRDPHTRTWWRLEDKNVSKTSERDIQSNTAVVLFYKRIHNQQPSKV